MAGSKLLKRKGGVDEISDDFCDFSLSSPATKIRRLDAGVLPPIVEEEEPPSLVPAPNEERALVLFKPLHHHSPSSYSLTVDSGILSEIKNQQLPWWSREEEQDDKSKNHRLAIVPWVPQHTSSSILDDENTNAEMMEADDDMVEQEEGDGEGVMDIEEEQVDTPIGNTSTPITNFSTTLNLPEGFQQQQHCFLPQFPQNTSTPITWTR